jgi:hypothetical protein
MSKRNSIIIILLIFILITGTLIFYYFSNGNAPAQNPQNITPAQGNLFGNTPSNGNAVVSTTTGGEAPAVSPAQISAKLIQIYKNPTSGSIFFTNKNNQNVLRFISRASGNAYEYLPESQTGEPIRITNTTIPKIQEAVWSSVGDNLVLRYLDSDTDNIVSFSAKIKISTTTPDSTGEITGTFLTTNIKEAVINPKGDKIFGLLEKNDKSGSYGIVYSFNDTSKKQTFDSPVSFWNISWPKENIITFTTKPSFNDLGYLFFFNTQTGEMSRVLGDVLGMSTLTNSDTSLVAYSKSQSGSFSLDIYDIKNKINRSFRMPTLADKCVWGIKNIHILYCAVPQNIPAGVYPDDWNQGLALFSDNIWMIDAETGTTKLIYQIGSNESASIDAVDLKISSDDQYLTFSNKADLSLWLLKIGQ